MDEMDTKRYNIYLLLLCFIIIYLQCNVPFILIFNFVWIKPVRQLKYTVFLLVFLCFIKIAKVFLMIRKTVSLNATLST